MGVETAIARYLHGRGVINLDETGTTGNAFLYAMPDEPNTAVVVKPSGGVTLRNEPAGYDEPTVQIIVRGELYDAKSPQDWAAEIYGELEDLRAITLDPGGDAEVYVVRIKAMQSAAADMGRDDNERHEFSQNYAVHIRNQTANRK